MERLWIAACFLSFVGLLLLIIALASDYWVLDIPIIHAGLWRICVFKACESRDEQTAGYVHATRAFLFMAMVAGAVSFFGLCALFFHTHIGSISIKTLAVWASIVAGVFSLIAMTTFSGLYQKGYGWSFGLGWASVPLFLITGGLAYKTVCSTTQRSGANMG